MLALRVGMIFVNPNAGGGRVAKAPVDTLKARTATTTRRHIGKQKQKRELFCRLYDGGGGGGEYRRLFGLHANLLAEEEALQAD